MTSSELRQKFLKFFEEKGHKVLPSASLLPDNDPTVLFTTAGMQPLVPYFLGQKHPMGTRLADAQKCLRTDDIDEVGDTVHHTFFEMLGNWSLGDYWKKEAIEWSFEFLTSSEWMNIDKEKLAVSVFAGDDDAPFDQESYDIWISQGLAPERIAKLPKKNNWWGPAGATGPCGPDTEMFVWTGEGDAPATFDPEDSRWVEIWNDVFMEFNKQKRTILVDGMHCFYNKEFQPNEELVDLLSKINAKKIIVVYKFGDKAEEIFKDQGYEVFWMNGEVGKNEEKFFQSLMDKYSLTPDDLLYFDHTAESVETARKIGIKSEVFETVKQIAPFIEGGTTHYAPLEQQNVDTGMGLERMTAVMQGVDDNYRTDIFWPLIEKIGELSGKKYEGNEKAFRIIADHLRAATFLIADGAVPSNVGAGYIVRRLIRRAIRYGKQLGIDNAFISQVAREVAANMGDAYTELAKQEMVIVEELDREEEKFGKTLETGLRELEKMTSGNISGEQAFLLFQSYGFPFEMTAELAEEKGIKVDAEGFQKEFEKHQELSRSASAGMFKGGLADNSEISTKYHTATHLLLAALREILGPETYQKGSNITAERMRFDFNYPEKLTPDQIQEIEDRVNEKIQEGILVTMEEMPKEEALKVTKVSFDPEKYGDTVKVYTIGDYSSELCGGPHVANTSELGHFKIVKEESSSAGIRRIKAVLDSGS